MEENIYIMDEFWKAIALTNECVVSEEEGESIIKKDNEIEVIKQELEEEKEISNKALEMISEKDDEIKELKEKIEKNNENTEKSDNDQDAKKKDDLDELKLRAKRKIEKPKNVISKAENINLPKIYTKVKEKPQKKIKLKIDKGINKLEIKGKKKAKDKNNRRY